MRKQVFLFLAVLFLLTLFHGVLASHTLTETEIPLHGWAWAVTGGQTGTGWISFNSTEADPDATNHYLVKVDASTLQLSGYAWTSNMGWIRFDPKLNTGENFPDLVGSIRETSKLERIGFNAYNLVGWARSCLAYANPETCEGALVSETISGGWDGWVSFSGKDDDGTLYGVKLNGRDFSGSAWGSDLFGKISFWGITRADVPYNVTLEREIEATISCAPDPNIQISGSDVTWRALVTGGSGATTYTWSGDDGLTGTTQNVTRRYTNTSADDVTKNASIKVKKGGIESTASCTPLTVIPLLSVSACSASPNPADSGATVTWRAGEVTGGSGTVSYSWTGDDSLSGTAQSVVKKYTNESAVNQNKSANFKVTKGSQEVTGGCSAVIKPQGGGGGGGGAFGASCSATPSTQEVNKAVKWEASVTGADLSTVSYSWLDDAVSESTNSFSNLSYSTVGDKKARVTITSGAKTATSPECKAKIISAPATPSFSVTCRTEPVDFQDSGEPVRFIAETTGGSGPITYAWSGDFTATTQIFNKTPAYENKTNAIQNHDATIRVTDKDGKTANSTCSIGIYPDSASFRVSAVKRKSVTFVTKDVGVSVPLGNVGVDSVKNFEADSSKILFELKDAPLIYRGKNVTVEPTFDSVKGSHKRTLSAGQNLQTPLKIKIGRPVSTGAYKLKFNVSGRNVGATYEIQKPFEVILDVVNKIPGFKEF